MGTVPMKVWQAGLKGETNNLELGQDACVEFKKVLDLHYDPRGWIREPVKPKK